VERANRTGDYHEYVFRDGKLVGKFDDMYRYSKEVPWHQDKTSHGISAEIDIAILKQRRYRSICDVGCGLGYFTDRLSRELNAQVTGIDISETATSKAGTLFPRCRFITGDLAKEALPKTELFDLVTVKEVFWYVTSRLGAFLENVTSLVSDNGYLYVSQSFPECEKWVGQDVIGSPEALRKILSGKVDIVYHCTEIDWDYHGRPFVHILGKKRSMRTG